MDQSFWTYDPGFWFQELQSSAQGLSDLNADAILKRTAPQKKETPRYIKDTRLFLGQFKSPLMLLLIAAVILSAFLGEASDVFIISFIILSTTLLSFFQERNAGRVVEKLQSMIALQSTVIRDGQAKEIDLKFIVTGDILQFKAGDIVPADCLLTESNELHANEAGLTGESFPVQKIPGKIDANTPLAKRSNCLWEGSSIISGTGKALVIMTEPNTLFGQISRSAATTTETTFEKGIRHFGYFLMKITMLLSIFILVVNLLFHRPLLESVLFALALAVGMAPELLPAISTIAMSAGARRMLQKKVIVKKLPAIQNLGEINLLCTDKTGTITEGTIVVEGIYDAAGNRSDLALNLAFINATLESGYANPIDDALRRMPVKLAVAPVKLGEIPYDFIRKRLTILADLGGQRQMICKGAVDNILNQCSGVLSSDGSVQPISDCRQEIEKLYASFGEKGFRVIGICYKNCTQSTITKEDETDMVFAGFISLEDPVKPGINETLAQLSKLKVEVKIITGDNRNVAACIAKEIGIAEPVILTGEEMDAMNPEAFMQKAITVQIFAEVEPRQKERIIQALRKNSTVAYMGDGINDVAAINAADVGISVCNAVDVAREAADFVLMETDLGVLAEGIREGRKTFANTLKYIFINTGSTFGNMVSVAGASLMLPFLPMLPKQILLTNFITDFPYLSVASDNVDEEQMDRPGKWNIKLIRNYMLYFGIHSSLFDLITFGILFYVLRVTESSFQTSWFIESVLSELFVLFIIRTRKSFTRSRPGKTLFILSILGLIITLVLPYLGFMRSMGFVPLPFSLIASMIGIVFAYILTADLLKTWFFKKFGEK